MRSEISGLAVTGLAESDEQYPGATIMDGALESGTALRAFAFGRDQRDGQVAAKLWHRLMYKDPGLPVLGSRLQTVEHLAYASMLADQGHVSAPKVLKTGSAGQDIALLVTDVPTGTPLPDLADHLTDATLAVGVVDGRRAASSRRHARQHHRGPPARPR